MFFKPPEVKAISRYSDFGSHLGVRSFSVMLFLALALHGTLIGFYAMMPHSKVVKIPVRVLNINLGVNVAETAPVSEQPLQEQLPPPPPPPPPVEASVTPKALPEESAKPKPPQIELDKALAAEKAEHAAAQKAAHDKAAAAAQRAATDKKIAAMIVPEKKPAPARKISVKDTAKDLTQDATKDTAKPAPIAAPKQYVRESPLDLTSPSAIANANAKPEEIVQRYTQDLSLWVKRYEIYPVEAQATHAEGEVIVRIRTNRQGHILYHSIETSSGNAFLDGAAQKMVEAANPVPPVPKNLYVNEDVLEFLVPVNFILPK